MMNEHDGCLGEGRFWEVQQERDNEKEVGKELVMEQDVGLEEELPRKVQQESWEEMEVEADAQTKDSKGKVGSMEMQRMVGDREQM